MITGRDILCQAAGMHPTPPLFDGIAATLRSVFESGTCDDPNALARDTWELLADFTKDEKEESEIVDEITLRFGPLPGYARGWHRPECGLVGCPGCAPRGGTNMTQVPDEEDRRFFVTRVQANLSKAARALADAQALVRKAKAGGYRKHDIENAEQMITRTLDKYRPATETGKNQ